MDVLKIGMPASNTMEQVAKAAFGGVAQRPDEPSAGGSDFAGMIQQSLAQVNGAQASAETTAHQYQLGQNDVSLEDAMISMQKASIGFQTTVQVRNKLVSAYNDIMNMQI